MAETYIGEIRMFGGNFAPAGWAFCDGSLLPISEYDALFNLIGTTYGGDGQETFALPDLRGRVPLHQGANAGTTFVPGSPGGVETVTLNTQQMPQHTHPFLATNVQGTDNSPAGNQPAISESVKLYINEPPDAAMNAGAVTVTGGSQPHDNFQPYLCVSFIFSLFGVYPSQT